LFFAAIIVVLSIKRRTHNTLILTRFLEDIVAPPFVYLPS
jgi:hypothetical protein